MATKSNAAETPAEVADDATVPHQASKSAEPTKVTSIKKHEEPEFYGEDETDGDSLKAKALRLLKNRKVIAGVVTTTVLGTAVLVIRKRNSAEQDGEETTEA